jgi:uncharacterized protein
MWGNTLYCVQGYAHAQYKIGLMYRQGRGVTQNDNEANKWFQKAADQGHLHAQHKVAFVGQ